MKLDGKVAVVTGGAMGNGLGIVKVFLKYGAKVIILDSSEALTKTMTDLVKEGHEVSGYLVDIRKKDDVKEAIKLAFAKYGKIDILVNNAGVAKLTPFLTTEDEIRDLQLDVNIRGTWNVTQVTLPYLMKNKKAAIINLSSVTGPMVADTGEVAYATTKAAILGFTKSLAAELVENNIRVNAILPGYIQTPMVKGIARDTDKNDPQAVIDGIAAGIPMKRLGTVFEVGELAAFLACEESSYITGQGIVIDGASTLPETRSVGVNHVD